MGIFHEVLLKSILMAPLNLPLHNRTIKDKIKYNFLVNKKTKLILIQFYLLHLGKLDIHKADIHTMDKAVPNKSASKSSAKLDIEKTVVPQILRSSPIVVYQNKFGFLQRSLF